MKTTLSTIAVILVLTAGVASASPTDAWLDLENCAMCRNLTIDQELFTAMTWETLLFENGLVEINTVPAGYEERFEKLMTRLMEAGKKMEAGEEMPLCGMCQSYGALMMAGAAMEQLQAGKNHISIISSRDPEVVEMIRAHGQRTIDEYAKWQAAEASHDHGQEGH